MLQVLKPVDVFKNDYELFIDLIEQFKRAFEDDPEMRISDFCEGELFPNEEYILDTETGNIIKANEYVEKLINDKM